MANGRKKIEYVPTVSVGNILTFFAFIIGAAAFIFDTRAQTGALKVFVETKFEAAEDDRLELRDYMRRLTDSQSAHLMNHNTRRTNDGGSNP